MPKLKCNEIKSAFFVSQIICFSFSSRLAIIQSIAELVVSGHCDLFSISVGVIWLSLSL